jgi:hypothetical protein
MKKRKKRTSVKKKAHTKENLVLCTPTQKVVYLGPTYCGSTVDITMARQQKFRLPHGLELLVDLGFLGLRIAHVQVLLPHKKPRKQELSQEQKDYNALLASARVVNEYAIGGIKRSRCVKDKFRNWKRGFDDKVMCLATALHNLRVSTRVSYSHSPLTTVT